MLQRMLVDKIENRILVGIVAFLAMMVVLGWVAINENGRMVSFTIQHEARSIERGAEIFASTCATCHGNDARGLSGRAPGLNNPHLFGYDYFASIKERRASLQAEQTSLENERNDLATELAGGVSDRRQTEIETRIAEIDERLAETGIPAELAALDIEEADLTTAMTTAIDNGYDPETPSRLTQANWSSTIDQFIFTTLVHGRGMNAALWNDNVMPAWSSRAGGSLRDDQLWDLTAYIKNFDKGSNWTLDDLLAVQQFAQVPGQSGAACTATAEAAGSDVTAILSAWDANGIVGNAERGQQLYERRTCSEVGVRITSCAGCHAGGAQGPATEGTWDRVVDERLPLPQFAGYTPEQYLVESILHPGAYVVANYSDGVMPVTFDEQLSVQDLADIVAYLETTSASYVPPPTAEGGEETTATEEATVTEEAP